MRRPLIFDFAQAFQGGRFSPAGIEMEVEYDRYADARSFWRMAAIVWGTVGLTEAAVRVVVIQNVSTSTALAINRIAPFVIVAGLIAWTVWAGARAREDKPVGVAPDEPAATPGASAIRRCRFAGRLARRRRVRRVGGAAAARR